MTIIELRNKRVKLLETMDGFLATHKNDKGYLSAEDDNTYASMEAEVHSLTNEIKRLERREEMEAELKKPVSAPITEKPETPKAETKVGRASDTYKDAFWNVTRSMSGVSYEVRNALKEGVDSEGGYLVPDEFENTLVQSLGEDLIFRNHAHVITTSSGSHKIPVATTKGTAAWVDEEGTIPEGDDTFGQQTIDAHKVGTIIKVSEELLNDSAFDLENYFATEFARRIGDKEEDAFFNGNGVKKPLGIFADEGGAQIGVTAADSEKITADEIINLYYSLKAPYRKHAIWVFNDETMATIRKLKGTDGQYLWQKALNEKDHETLLGRPIYTSSYVPEFGAGNKVAAFGDFRFYWIGDRQGISFKRLNERFADSGQVGFLATKRLDGKLILPEAIKVLQMKKA